MLAPSEGGTASRRHKDPVGLRTAASPNYLCNRKIGSRGSFESATNRPLGLTYTTSRADLSLPVAHRSLGRMFGSGFMNVPPDSLKSDSVSPGDARDCLEASIRLMRRLFTRI